MFSPTTEVYSELQEAFSFFNQELFNNELPACLITLQRERKSFGYFSRRRFVRRSGQETDEIAMNPSFFAVRPITETLATLVHEMCHMWQAYKGKPGRRGYHNKQWAQIMESIGLMPTTTGQPGGKKTGESVQHYIIKDGPFDAACKKLLTTEFTFSWVDRFPPCRPAPVAAGAEDESAEEEVESEELEALIELGIELPPEEPANKSNRVKYRCSECSIQVWGKPNLNVLCGDCEIALEPTA